MEGESKGRQGDLKTGEEEEEEKEEEEGGGFSGGGILRLR